MGIGHELSIGREKKKNSRAAGNNVVVSVSSLYYLFLSWGETGSERITLSHGISVSFLGSGSGGSQVNGNYHLKEQIAT